MFHELILFSLFNSSTILKELDVSLLHRTTSLRPGFFTLPSITLLVLIQLAKKLVNILIFKFFSSFLSGLIDQKGEKTKMYFFTISVIHVHSLIMNKIFFSIYCCLVYVFCVFLRFSQVLSSSQKGGDC